MATKITPSGSSSNSMPDYKIGEGLAKKADLISESLDKQRIQSKAPSSKEYDVDVSADAKIKAREFKKALEVAQKTPDVREDKVAKYKAMINNGQYHVDAGKVADGILNEAIKDRLSLEQ